MNKVQNMCCGYEFDHLVSIALGLRVEDGSDRADEFIEKCLGRLNDESARVRLHTLTNLHTCAYSLLAGASVDVPPVSI